MFADMQLIINAIAAPRVPLSLHDALPISPVQLGRRAGEVDEAGQAKPCRRRRAGGGRAGSEKFPPRSWRFLIYRSAERSVEHTCDILSLTNIVCRLLMV